MTTAKKKVTSETEPTAQPQADIPATAKLPALVAYHMIPGPQGQQGILTPIGSAVEHPDGEGFTLHLQLVPTTGGQIILRKFQAKKAANGTPPATA